MRLQIFLKVDCNKRPPDRKHWWHRASRDVSCFRSGGLLLHYIYHFRAETLPWSTVFVPNTSQTCFRMRTKTCSIGVFVRKSMGRLPRCRPCPLTFLQRTYVAFVSFRGSSRAHAGKNFLRKQLWQCFCLHSKTGFAGVSDENRDPRECFCTQVINDSTTQKIIFFSSLSIGCVRCMASQN